MDDEILLIYDELLLDGCGIIGKHRKDGRWDAKTYKILKRLRELAYRDEIVVEFNSEDGSVTLYPVAKTEKAPQ